MSDAIYVATAHAMSTAKGLKVVGYFDCAGGGQVVVRDGVAYVGHVKPPNGTTLVDVSDPANPRNLSQIKVPEGTLRLVWMIFRINGNRTDHPVQIATRERREVFGGRLAVSLQCFQCWSSRSRLD